MGYAKTALTLLRLGIGLFLIFTAVTRLMGLEALSSFASVYGAIGGEAAINQSVFSVGISIFLGLLGLLLLSGKLLVVGGVLVVIVGLVSGVSEIIASQTLPLAAIERFTRLSNGVRDVLVLASAGGAIAALDSYIRHRVYRDTQARRANLSMYREDRPASTPVGTSSGKATTIRTTHDDEPPRGPYV